MQHLFRSCRVVFALAVFACVQARAGDFTLKAETVEALEDGPVILRLTLTFQGENPVSAISDCLTAPDGGAVSAPKGWKRIEPFMTDGTGHLVGYLPLKRGDQFSTTTYAHERFRRIPSGPASLKVSWWVSFEGGRTLEVTTRLDLNVPPATAENIAAIRKRIEADLLRPGLKETDRRGIYRRILGTRHRPFVPLALRLIASRDGDYLRDDLIDYAYKQTEAPDEVHSRLVALAGDPTWRGKTTLFQFWRYRRTALPLQQFQKLLGTKNIWTRVLTYMTFPRQCDKAWTAALLREVRDQVQPLSKEEFAQLLRDLDDASFVVREKASAKLEQLGERVESHLRQASQTTLSLEVKRRVRSSLDKIATTPLPPDCDRIIRYLIDTMRTPEADAILAALADGDPNLRLTQYVKTALDVRRKASSSNK